MRTLVLWDIDGTLLVGSRAATVAFNNALREIYELQEEPARIDYGGKTDHQIALEVLALHQIEEAVVQERLARFQEHYIGLLGHAFDDLRLGVRLLPGVTDVLDAIQQRGAIQSTLTGNFRATAELKLRAAGLDHRLLLDIGAFGSDHHDRDELVPIALRKAEARFGPIDRTVVVGDTPRDIACGKAGGAWTVAVATGHWSGALLEQHRPDVLLPDLADTAAAVVAIMGR
jgi:phosphoglycolate phosphatase